ncbi:MAG: hypothetical protein AAF985_09265 [Bacteroidota bacterium]
MQLVEGKSNTYDQRLNWEPRYPVKCEITITATNKKGKEETFRYLINLRDIDKNTIRSKNEKELMKLSMVMDNRQKLIRYYQDGEQENYREKMDLYATDVDNSRQLEQLFKQAVETAQQIQPMDLPKTFAEQMAWLKEKIRPIEIGETVYEQSLSQDETISTLLTYQLVKAGKKSREENYLFNLVDLKENQVRLKVKGKLVSIELPSQRKLKFIQQSVDGNTTKFSNQLTFYGEDLDPAKRIVDVMRRIIPQSRALDKKRFPPKANAFTLTNA